MPILINEVVSEFVAPQKDQVTQNDSLSASGASSTEETLRKVLQEQQLILSREQRLQVD
ncbi:MAG: hypothetical protein GY694_07025 [Gammaproteobacteria bacterium]|nr:hypothetical protein [Gammaproteobacteria bacterium]